MSVTIIIIIINVAVSLLAFQNHDIMTKLIFWPARMRNNPAEFHRFLTAGFIHADMMHLALNMFSLYSIGLFLEQSIGSQLYIMLYLSGIIVSKLPGFVKYGENPGYTSLGASGGVSAVMLATVYLSPWSIVYFIVIPMPFIVFAIAFLAYSTYLTKKGGGRINHEAHLWGAIFGFLFMLAIDPSHGMSFVNLLMHPSF